MTILGKHGYYAYYDEPPKHKFRNFLLYVIAVVMLLALLGFVVNYAQNRQCRLDRQVVTVHNLPGDLENWSILHLSDLNGREVGAGQAAVRKAIDGKAFSCIVMTGDMIGEKGDVTPLMEVLSIMPENVPVMLIPGDLDPQLINMSSSDSLSVFSSWARKLQEAGVIILDRPVSFTRGKSTIWFVPEELYSLDIDGTLTSFTSLEKQLTSKTQLTPDEAARLRVARYQIVRMRDVKEISRQMKPGDMQVCVCHTPLKNEYIGTMYSWQQKDTVLSFHNVSLVLAGHYAGGQWRIPGFRAIYVPEVGFFPEDSQIQGLDYVGGIPQYISPGLGDSSFYPFPGRLFNPPSVGQIVLTSTYR